ncbi:hypothetical protein ACS5PN_27775 [Roseateles sp. NT4]|uniref:hypothetical protein n=1 Tax=Roseateles sp. NT4 TaxID=3453715 RepID=UPI003EEF2C53
MRARCQRWTGRALWLACGLVLAGCGVTIEKPQMPTLATAPPPNPLALGAQDIINLNRYVQSEREAAQAAMASGQHRAAAGHWSTVLALRPEDAEALAGRQVAVAAAQVAAQQYFQRAQMARNRGDVEGAQRLALEALARDPESTEAVQALRQWQRDRNRASGRVEPKPASRAGAKPAGFSGEDWEYASLLSEAGDIEGALQLLLPAASRPGADSRLRSRACELLLDLARSRQALNDNATAIASLERCLRIEPKHAEATRLLQSLKAAKR